MSRILIIVLGIVSLMAPAQDRTVTKKEEIITEKTVSKTVKVTRLKTKKFFVFVFDYSGSMAGVLESNKKQLRGVLDNYRSDPNWTAAAIPFAGCYKSVAQVRKLAIGPGKNVPDQIGEKIWDGVKNLRATGGTDLTKAIQVGLEIAGSDGYAEVFLYTDRAGNCGGNWQQLLKQLEQQQVVENVKTKVKVLERRFRIHVVTEAAGKDKLQLKKLSQATGGKYLDSEKKYLKFIDRLQGKEDLVETVEVSKEKEDTELESSSEVEMEQETERQQTQKERARQKAEQKKKKEIRR